MEAQWQIGYGVRLRIKRSSVRIRPWPLRWVLGQGSLLPLSQGEAFPLTSISYLAILVVVVVLWFFRDMALLGLCLELSFNVLYCRTQANLPTLILVKYRLAKKKKKKKLIFCYKDTQKHIKS